MIVRIIATAPAENEILAELTEHLSAKGIVPSVINYEDGFGITVWSVYDLDEIPAARNWTHEKRLRFMEKYGSKIGGATEDSWAKISSYVDEYLKAD
jgi:ATP-dependent RNA circularization protein (DNA/RNA ligase family)